MGEYYTELIAIISGVIFLLRKQITRHLTELIVSLMRYHYHQFNKRTIENYQQVHAMLIETCNEFNAESVCLHQFHNGQIFASNNPIWKISCSHEYCKPGLQTSAEMLQNVPASSVALVLSSIDKGAELQGVDVVKCECKGVLDCSNQYKFIAQFNIEQMPDFPLKRIRTLCGYEHSLVVPVHKNGHIIGFLEILTRFDLPFDMSPDIARLLCVTAAKLSYVLAAAD